MKTFKNKIKLFLLSFIISLIALSSLLTLFYLKLITEDMGMSEKVSFDFTFPKVTFFIEDFLI